MVAEPVDPTAQLAAIMAMVEALSTLITASASYRAKCEADGFSPSAAESMAADLHSHLLVQAFKAIK
jgi:hypothetical protein